MMALVVDQQSNGYKHFCKICNKGFKCGRALGCHIRTHGIGNDFFHLEDDDPVSADWNGPKATHASTGTNNNINNNIDAGGNNRRSMRVKVDNFGSVCPSREEENLANCLMMLSSGMVHNPSMAEPEESFVSTSRVEDHRRPSPVSFIPQLTYRSTTTMDKVKEIDNNNNNNKGIFECKACKKGFNSHQALGGHRASHKKVKGCFAARIDREYDYAPDNNALMSGEFFLKKSTPTLPFIHGPSPPSSKKKSKVHECMICHRVFSSGQALGGHKRCHWITSNGAAAEVPSLAKLASLQEQLERIQQQRPTSFINVDHDPLTLELDLNLPAPLTTDARFDKVILTEKYLRSWLGCDAKEIQECNDRSAGNNCDVGVKKTNENDVVNNCGPLVDNNNNNNSSSNNLVNVADDEAHSKVKLAKLCELNDSKISGSSSSWLQVGIGKTAAKDEAATSAGK